MKDVRFDSSGSEPVFRFKNADGVDHGGVGGQHYWARDMFKLGMEYANIIVDNNLVD